MKHIFIYTLLSLSFILCANAATVYKAIAHIRPTALGPTGLSGSVEFEWIAENDVLVTINLVGLPSTPSHRGIHIHQYGDLGNVTTVGGHYNPNNGDHGCPPNAARHAGDMGVWNVTEEGEIHQSKHLDLIDLEGVDSIIGRSVVVHAQEDDCEDVNSSGPRHGYGVIGISTPGEGNTNSAVFVSDATTDRAICHLIPIGGSGVSGVVLFETDAHGNTTISARVTGLQDGSKHGFHIHEYGDLTNATTVGGHYNPYSKPHSLPGFNGTERHVGDLGNIYFYYEGNAYYRYNGNSLVKLASANNVIGRAVVVHANEDRCDVPSAGGRIAFCVIGLASPMTQYAIPDVVSSTQDTSACDPASPTTTTTTGSEDNGASQFAYPLAISILSIMLINLFVNL